MSIAKLLKEPVPRKAKRQPQKRAKRPNKRARIKMALEKMGYTYKPPAKPQRKAAGGNTIYPSSNRIRTDTFIAQDGVCHYCERQTLFEHWTVDHLIPRCRGGGNTRQNTVGCCSGCNNAKGPMTVEEFNNAGRRRHKTMVMSIYAEIAPRQARKPLDAGMCEKFEEIKNRLENHREE